MNKMLDANLKVYELGIKLTNYYKQCGFSNGESCVNDYKTLISKNEYKMFLKGVHLVENAIMPEVVNLVLNIEFEKIKNTTELTASELTSLVLIIKIINWIQTGGLGELDTIGQLFESSDEVNEIRSWCQFNKLDWKITIEDLSKMTNEKKRDLMLKSIGK